MATTRPLPLASPARMAAAVTQRKGRSPGSWKNRQPAAVVAATNRITKASFVAWPLAATRSGERATRARVMARTSSGQSRVLRKRWTIRSVRTPATALTSWARR